MNVDCNAGVPILMINFLRVIAMSASFFNVVFKRTMKLFPYGDDEN